MRAATPVDAEAVWKSIEAAGGKPTTRTVTNALNASGEFEPVAKSTVARWAKNGFKPVQSLRGFQERVQQEKTAIEAALPALTGDATVRVADVIDEDEREDLEVLTDDALARKIAREAAVTSVLLMRQISREAQKLQLAENLGIAVLVQTLGNHMKTINEMIGIGGGTKGGRVIEADAEETGMNDALAAFREARTRAN